VGTTVASVTLAPFAHDWIGGDIDGLAQLAGTLYGYAPEVTGVAAALDAQVRRVVDAAGWQGRAASAFMAAWQRDSVTAEAVGLAADQIADIVGWLAVTLSQIEAGLEAAAAQAAAQGVPVGAEGQPPQVCYATPGGAGQVPAQQWLAAYQSYYEQSLRAARGARGLTAGTLAAMTSQITSNASAGPARLAGDGTTVADLLGDLLAGPSAARRENARELSEIEKDVADLKTEGRSVDKVLSDIESSMRKLNAIDAAEIEAKAGETALGKLADARVGDAIDRALNALPGGGAHGRVPDPDADGGLLGSIADVGRDIPVLDVLAAGLGTVLGAYQDTHGARPQSLGVALPEEAGANFGGLAVAAAVADMAGGPAGIAVGTLLPDDIDNTLHEPWSADIHNNGWAKGLAAANGNIAENNLKDVVSTLEDNDALTLEVDETLAHGDIEATRATQRAAESLWHDIL
jgi:uncharacterized protein YukE